MSFPWESIEGGFLNYLIISFCKAVFFSEVILTT